MSSEVCRISLELGAAVGRRSPLRSAATLLADAWYFPPVEVATEEEAQDAWCLVLSVKLHVSHKDLILISLAFMVLHVIRVVLYCGVYTPLL